MVDGDKYWYIVHAILLSRLGSGCWPSNSGHHSKLVASLNLSFSLKLLIVCDCTNTGTSHFVAAQNCSMKFLGR